jgi:gamma-glutamyltranspeptidase / glutathione hydrolase
MSSFFRELKQRKVYSVALGYAVVAWLVVQISAVVVNAQDRSQGRSMVTSRNGIVAAESPIAAQAGVHILEQGGNAIDAAIATNAMMGVVAPMMNGIGGDLFAITYDAKANKLYGLNASGWAPESLTIEYLRNEGLQDMPRQGVNTITVPGTVDGWHKLVTKFGRKSLAEDLAAAIRTARGGFAVTEMTGAYWASEVDHLRKNEAATKLYLPGDRAPKVGEVFRNPELAASLEQIAQHGRDAFYNGEITLKIIEAIKKYGGVMTRDDLAKYSAEWVEPISTTYRDWTVFELPPNVQGLAALEMLNIFENFPLGQKGYEFGAANTLHIMIEAKKLAYADLKRYIGDPHGQTLPVAQLLSKDWAAQRAKLISEEHANCSPTAGELREGTDTTYLSVVDREGNMVSLIQSNASAFGSGIVAPGTGFVLHNRGALFVLDPSSPNALAGHKHPLHTIIPAFARKGEVRVAFGIMGGWNQPQAHAQFIANFVDFKMNIQAALEAPRFTQSNFTGCEVMMEDRFPQKARDELTMKGHQIKQLGTFSSTVGGGQVVLRDFAAGVNFGASDPRKDGEAIAELP